MNKYLGAALSRQMSEVHVTMACKSNEKSASPDIKYSISYTDTGFCPYLGNLGSINRE